VICNLDRKKQNIKVDKEWSNYKLLLENDTLRDRNYGMPFGDENREIAFEEKIYTMEPYEFMVLGNVKN